jgi:hypothetical protein
VAVVVRHGTSPQDTVEYPVNVLRNQVNK